MINVRFRGQPSKASLRTTQSPIRRKLLEGADSLTAGRDVQKNKTKEMEAIQAQKATQLEESLH